MVATKTPKPAFLQACSQPALLASSATTPFTQVSPPLLAPCYQPTIPAGLPGLGFQILPSPHLPAHLGPVRMVAPLLLHLQPRWAFATLSSAGTHPCFLQPQVMVYISRNSLVTLYFADEVGRH